MTNTAVTLLYRDGCNYKTSDVVIFAGEPTDELKDRLTATLDEHEWLVPAQVDLEHPATHNDIFAGRYPDQEDDHGFVEVERDWIEATEAAPTDQRTFTEFVAACEAVAFGAGWDPDLQIQAVGGWQDEEKCAQLRGSVD